MVRSFIVSSQMKHWKNVADFIKVDNEEWTYVIDAGMLLDTVMLLLESRCEYGYF